MKFCIILAILTFSTLSYAKIVKIPIAQPPQKCDFSCTTSDMLLCATNGQCMKEFRGECMLSAYNCEHPQKPFVIVEDWKCKKSGSPKCSQKELE